MERSLAWEGQSSSGETISGSFSVTVDEGIGDVDRVLSGEEFFSEGFTVPEGEIWEFDPGQDTRVQSRGNVVVRGTLRMVPSSFSVHHHLEFVDVDESLFQGDGSVFSDTDVGLWIMGDGVVDASGLNKESWTRATGGIPSGVRTFEVENAEGWQVGDEIVITPTVEPDVSAWHRRYDRKVISEISGNTVTVDTELVNPHPETFSPRDNLMFTAEVLNLTRNVKITGTPGGKSHIEWMHSNQPVHWDNVEVAHMGPRQNQDGILGRYAMHMHHLEWNADGSVFRNVVGHDNGFHVFVAHESHGVTFDRCVSHDSYDSAYWWDPAVSGHQQPFPNNPMPTFNCWWKDCVGSLIRWEPTFRGYRLNAFNLLQGEGNKMTGCVAVGVDGSNDSAGVVWPEMGPTLDEGVWEFRDNVIHNCSNRGVFTWQNTDLVHDVERTWIYNCRSGLGHGAYLNHYNYTDFEIWNCNLGVEMMALSTVEEGLKFDRFKIDLRGHGGHAILASHHSLNGREVLLRDCDLLGYTNVAVLDSNDKEAPTRLALHDCYFAEEDLPKVTISSISPSGTVIRELEDGVEVQRYTN